MEPEPFKKKRKGGIHQRLKATEQDYAVESALQVMLLLNYAQGILSAYQISELARAAKKDIDLASQGYTFPKLNRLAKVQHGKNLQGSILRELANDSDLPKPKEFDIPMKQTSSTTASSNVLLPHEMFHYFFKNAKGWAHSMVPDEKLIPKFWESFNGHPCMDGHPVLAREDYKRKCVPLSIHGDETPITGVGKVWSRKALLLTWSSLIAILGGNNAEDCNIYITGLFEKFIIPTSSTTLGTMDCIWKILKWSFLAIWNGTWPVMDPWGRRYPKNSPEGAKGGQPLANGYYGCLLQICGDLDYYCLYLGLPRWSLHNNPCSQCRCNYEGIYSWLDNRSTSQWQNTLLTPHDWKTHWTSTCELFQLPGVSALSVTMDLMHCLYLGWLQYVYGSVISLLVFDCYGGEDHLANLLAVGQYIQNFQMKNKMRQRYNRRLDQLTMFQSGTKFPKLRGKAAEIQSLAETLWSLWSLKMDQHNEQHRLIEFLLRFNNQIHQILAEYHPRYGFLSVPLPQAKELFDLGLKMSQVHYQLMVFYRDGGQKLFNLTTKTHFCLHSLFLSRWIHPAAVWCYKGEDQMQRAAKVWKSCLKGSKHFQVAKKAAWKERHLLQLRGKIG